MSKFFKELEAEVNKTKAVLLDFQKEFKAHPVHALTWSDKVFEAAVFQQIGKEVLKWDKDSRHNEIKDRLGERLLVCVQGLESNSTSISSNHVHRCQTIAWMRICDMLNWHPHTPEEARNGA